MFLECNVNAVPTLGLWQPSLATVNEATSDHRIYEPRLGSLLFRFWSAAESSWGVPINIFINPSPTSVSEIHLDTQPTLIFINSFF